MKRLVRGLLPLLLLLVGVGVAVALVRSRPRAERSSPATRALRVEVVEATPQSLPVHVRGTGTVQPSRRVSLSAEVSGRITHVAPAVVPGGRLKEGELLARIDPRDYEVAVQQEESRVKAAELELQLEQGRQQIAVREWELLSQGRPVEESPLALRKPQLAATEQALLASKAGLARARLNLERTSLRAPFNALVLTESLEAGQVVSPGSAVATLIGTDRFWVSVSVAVEDLARLDIPGLNAEQGSPAQVMQRLGGEAPIVRSGAVLRLQGELDPQARTATLLVAVDRPLDPPNGGLPLLSGAYVEVDITGRPVEGSYLLPRTALVEGNQVWLVTAQGTLSRRQVEVAWRTREEVIISRGLQQAERVVISPLAMPIEGMPVEVQVAAAPARPTVDAPVAGHGPL